MAALITALPAFAQLEPETPLATPLPTEPPAILVVQPTPLPTAVPQGNLIQQAWEENRIPIATAAIIAILIGVFLNRISSSISNGLGKLGHFLFDRYAGAPIIRLRYEKRYRTTLADSLQTLASSNIVDREVRLDRVYVPMTLTEETLAGKTSFEDLLQ